MTNHAVAPPPVPTPWELRDDLVARVTADLLGPLDGEHEVIRGYQRDDGTWSSPGRVRDRYLVGDARPAGDRRGGSRTRRRCRARGRRRRCQRRHTGRPEPATGVGTVVDGAVGRRRRISHPPHRPLQLGGSTTGNSRTTRTAPGRASGSAHPDRSMSICCWRTTNSDLWGSTMRASCYGAGPRVPPRGIRG